MRGRIPGWVPALFAVVLLVGPFTDARILSSASGSPASTRDPLKWPFAPSSIWNLPIGENAVYVPARIERSTGWGMTVDRRFVIMTPNAPMRPLYTHRQWDVAGRCHATTYQRDVPVPDDFVYPPPAKGDNDSAVILLPDMRTFVQANVVSRCAARGPLTVAWLRLSTDIYGDGSTPGLGGSNLSALGGVLRLGELVPGAPPIRHALQVNLFSRENLFFDSITKGFRWPATKADTSAAKEYRGTNRALRMGSFLALPPAVDITAMGLETEPARMLAWTLQNYGAYVVNDTNWSVYAIITEGGPAGSVSGEFRSAWGFSFEPQSKTAPWSRDMDRLFLNLHVVDNWRHSLYNTVSASGGGQGAGSGTPRQPWAPSIFSP